MSILEPRFRKYLLSIQISNAIGTLLRRGSIIIHHVFMYVYNYILEITHISCISCIRHDQPNSSVTLLKGQGSS